MNPSEGETLGTLLKGLRVAASLTQEELAERAEVSARTISDTERGLRTSIYKDTALRIADALGLQAETRAAFERAARGRRGIPQPTAPPLPLPPTKLIGREADIDRVVEAIDGDARLVTLSGPGGIGKTRLALEVAHHLSHGYDGRTFFVQLGAISDARLVASEIARAVGVTWAPTDIIPAIVERLRGVDSLLVLDTFEHVLEAATDVASILTGAPTVRVIATSREALRVRGEHEIVVSPLSDVDDATALFVERASAVTDFVLDEKTAAAIAAICRKLDGVPLAIELAAARAKHLPLSVLLEQLARALDVLTGGARDLPERQRTMRDTVAWSEGLLEDDQRALFRELSVFAGGWTLDAAIAVCSPGQGVTPLLSALMDKSLVVRVSNEDEARYRMLDVIREFAAESRGDSREITERHRAFFLTLAAAAESALGSSSQERWFARLATDQDNIRVALSSAMQAKEAETALRFSGALWQFWRAHGDVVEGREWLRRSLALPGGSLATRAKAMWGAAWLAYHQDDYDEATLLGEVLADLAVGSSDPVVRR
ncbi:MAG TPA: helix-turn-helix domain-containing protein, partial [Actinomycetota bacterium]|nr:helix-turn-helix domain-containing protein [Actinomycetota bacterium]